VSERVECEIIAGEMGVCVCVCVCVCDYDDKKIEVVVLLAYLPIFSTISNSSFRDAIDLFIHAVYLFSKQLSLLLYYSSHTIPYRPRSYYV